MVQESCDDQGSGVSSLVIGLGEGHLGGVDEDMPQEEGKTEQPLHTHNQWYDWEEVEWDNHAVGGNGIESRMGTDSYVVGSPRPGGEDGLPQGGGDHEGGAGVLRNIVSQQDGTERKECQSLG